MFNTDFIFFCKLSLVQKSTPSAAPGGCADAVIQQQNADLELALSAQRRPAAAIGVGLMVEDSVWTRTWTGQWSYALLNFSISSCRAGVMG